MQKQPPEYRKKAARLVAGKCTLACRVDACHEAPDGQLGMDFLAEVEKRLEKMQVGPAPAPAPLHGLSVTLPLPLPLPLQEPPPPKKAKPLPKPDDPIRKKRAGKRVRRQKEKWGASQLHREANRMGFGELQDDLIQTKIGFNTGMMGKGGSGRVSVRSACTGTGTGTLTATHTHTQIRAPTVDDKTKTTISKRLQREVQKAKEVSGLSTGITTRVREGGGTVSSIAFTPVQGLEIFNPNAAERKGEAASKYFASTVGFRRPNP